MKINPDPPDSQPQIDSATTSSQTGKAFGNKLTSKSQPSGGTSNTEALTAAAEGVSKRDLADPIKAKAAVDRAVHEMLEREFGGMSTLDRERVAAWLRSDPIVSAALLKRLISLAH